MSPAPATGRSSFLSVRPDIKVLLTSGYAEDLVIDDQPGLAQLKILRKPYRQGDLVAALREVFAD